MSRHDLIVVGAGIVGLAHALAASRRGKRVLVLERDAQANGASIRNFGFVTVTGQERGRTWELASRSAAIWREIAGPAGIAIEQEGLLLVAQRPEAEDVIDAFLETEMSEWCERLDAAQISAAWPMIRGARAGVLSHRDLRIDSPLAIPKLARWLAESCGVEFAYGEAVHGVETGRVRTSTGTHEADVIVVCPGDDWATLYPQEFASAGITRCKLQMLRLAAPGWRLPSPVMSDLSMIRYLGYSALPQAAALRTRLQAEAAFALSYGVHLIVVQCADGSLVVGDSHEYAPTPTPFADTSIEDSILDAFADVLGTPPSVVSRWTGTYASATGHSIVRAPTRDVRLVVVTSGTGASTSFALAEAVIEDLLG